MGQEAEAELRREVFAPYQVNEELMSLAKPGALFMHCLPAHRGEEVTADVFESDASVVFDQAENRLHGQKALLLMLLAAALKRAEPEHRHLSRGSRTTTKASRRRSRPIRTARWSTTSPTRRASGRDRRRCSSRARRSPTASWTA